MMKNMKQVNKMLEQVNKEMNTSELVKVMDKFEQVRLILIRFYFDFVRFCVR